MDLGTLLDQVSREPERLLPLFGAIFLAGGLGVCARGHWMVARSRSWPSARGRIVGGEIGTETSYSNGVHSTVYVARIAYEYEVGGRGYRSGRIAVGGEMNTSGRARAERRLARYPVGETVEVFYDPADPARACLERRTEVTGLALLVAAVGAGIVLFTGL